MLITMKFQATFCFIITVQVHAVLSLGNNNPQLKAKIKYTAQAT